MQSIFPKVAKSMLELSIMSIPLRASSSSSNLFTLVTFVFRVWSSFLLKIAKNSTLAFGLFTCTLFNVSTTTV